MRILVFGYWREWGNRYLDYRKCWRQRPDRRPGMLISAVTMTAACTRKRKTHVEKPLLGVSKKGISSEACKRSGTLLAVAHRNRHPALAVAKETDYDGSHCAAMRGRGKQDHRGGGGSLGPATPLFFDLFCLCGQTRLMHSYDQDHGKIATPTKYMKGMKG